MKVYKLVDPKINDANVLIYNFRSILKLKKNYGQIGNLSVVYKKKSCIYQKTKTKPKNRKMYNAFKN